MVFQFIRYFHKLFIAFRQVFFQFGNRLWCTDTCHNILTLCVDQVFAVYAFLSGGRISGKSNACAGRIAHIAEYHRLYVDRRAPVARNIVHSSVYDGSFIIPGTEYGLNRFHQLYFRFLREILSFIFFINCFESDNDFFHIVRCQISIVGYSFGSFDFVKNSFEIRFGNLHNNVGEHLNKSSIRIVCESRISGLFSESLYRNISQSQIQNCVHHARHGCPCT